METIKKTAPGFLFVTFLAWISLLIQGIPVIHNLHINSLIIAILLGMLLKNIIKIPIVFDEGIRFSMKKILRLAIILLGFQLSFSEVSQIGGKGILLVVIVTTATILFTVWIGQKMGLDRNLSLLIGAGSSICGASAVAAVAPVIDAEERDTTFAIATVTIFGTIAMFLYPVFYRIFQLPSLLYAVWTGASIHEVAQVVAAGFAAGEHAGQFATIIKLSRVLLIIPAAIILGFAQVKRQTDTNSNTTWSWRKVSIPWFVFGFMAIIILNSIQIVPQPAVKGLVSLDSFLLTIAMAALGLETSLEKMKKVGLKPFYVGLITSVFISALGFLMSELLFA